MPTDNRQQLQPEKDLFLKCFEEHFELLSPLARGFYFLNFDSHTKLVPWILQKKDISQLHCDPKIKREVAFFISKLRYHLEKAGYDLESLYNETEKQSKNKSFLARFNLWPFGRKNKTPKPDTNNVTLSDLDNTPSDIKRMQNKLKTDLKRLHETTEKWKQELEEHNKFLDEQNKLQEEIQNSIEQRSKLIDDILTDTKEEKKRPDSKQEKRKKKKRKKNGQEKKREKNRERINKTKGKEKEKKKCEAKTKPKLQEKGKRQPVRNPFSQEKNDYEWNRRKDDYLINQYHQLICLFPYQTRKHIINIIPTMEDMLDKTTAYTKFSDRFACKKELDTFVSMFRFIYNEYPCRKYDIERLYSKTTGKQPHHDMTIYEKVMLHILENTKKPKDRERFLDSQHLPPPQENDDSYSSSLEFTTPNPATSVVCMQKERVSLQLDELFSPETAYPDFIILAVTLIQAAREVTRKLSLLKRHFNCHDLFAIVSLSKTRIHLYSTNEQNFLVEELLLTRENDKVYASLYDNPAEKRMLNVRTKFFDDLYEKEHEYKIWLNRLKMVLKKLSNDRLIVFSDFYTIKVFDKSNSQSCSIYTLIRWIESHDIWDVASQYHVVESNKTAHPKNFPGKFRY